MHVLRALLRTAKLIGYFTWFGLELLIRRPATRQARADWLHRFCAAALRGFDVKLTVEGEFPARGALISNHLSYLDIIVFAAMSPCVFCSKAEIKHWPILGWMTTMAGTVYVDRGRGGSAAKAGGEMKLAAEAGLPVVFFPEGTTSNGEQVLAFHSGLLAQAIGAEEPITGAYLSYSLDEENGEGVSVSDDVAYWGDVNMLKHIFRFLGLQGCHARVRIGDGPIAFRCGVKDRKGAAREAREAVLELAGTFVNTAT
ncbi:lysophospholipid acyltransferase family protein [Granulicella tundricola]|uniref:Phospholipid/glycerol acyltransferase n=1 Tax=Granulicella tundricola (strain ATCC BAA-1859 / DSM 23138 / MP5ACTX9) TaxID=1198114 RepID=E8X2Y7_GRATM|nr:lysophospholipid acyltransferase family protein [Granulicella tundricola]ADW68121.1 phospholipid/glycerol acyltransferase [Granulicella tundricola MP5ACTX9]